MALAIFSTWTTYGTWLPGDERGWFASGFGVQDGEVLRQLAASFKMSEDAVILDEVQRAIVERTVSDHCTIRNWQLCGVNCRSNHVHVLVASEAAIHIPREQFKSWCTRRLKAAFPSRTKWWTERGWDVYIDDEDSLAIVLEYIKNQ